MRAGGLQGLVRGLGGPHQSRGLNPLRGQARVPKPSHSGQQPLVQPVRETKAQSGGLSQGDSNWRPRQAKTQVFSRTRTLRTMPRFS